MQTALSFSSSFPSILTPKKMLDFPGRAMPRLHPRTPSCPSIKSSKPRHLRTPSCPSVKATTVACDASTFDYSSKTSVFLAEACETIGGEACNVEMYPEVKLQPDTEFNNKARRTASEMIDREYMEYNSPKTVFVAEACDDLGGEFCEPEYQTGVY